ncbi:hypothetical protein OsI_04699 [Oryza sativa Indica Group]|uniref:Uncharacterized protein n=1 Tax=Oryza sativa subsp. indica TaxID=39946 RepID=B8A7B7_ORYSI|nr:hypothetical protein OsI_04699 [Oryza sativa Indica Group]
MAAEVNQTFFAWSQGEPTERDGSQGVSVSQKIDHGSISFGRFELESLSWEKWSVFSDDKRHEEFGKFNGLVAQKKAYFEEYYRKIRELKAQQQNQQTELILEYSGDGSDSSQTGEYTQGAELETPTGSGTIVDDYVEQGAHETTSEQGLTCYDDHENENFNAEFSSSNISSSAVGLQQTGRDARENVHGDDSAGKMDLEQQNAISGHSLGTAYEVVRAPKRIIEKDSRLRYAPKIVPKSVKTSSDSPLDRTSVSKRPDSLKLGMSINQKAKTDNDRLLRGPNVAPHKMSGSTERNKLTTKQTGVRRPSSASSQRPSVGERHRIARESIKKPADVSTPRRPSTAERHPVTTECARKQADVDTPRRPSTSERRAVNKGSADMTTTHRPSTGERRSVTRESVLKMDVRTPSKTRPTMTQLKGATTTVQYQRTGRTFESGQTLCWVKNYGPANCWQTEIKLCQPSSTETIEFQYWRTSTANLYKAKKERCSSAISSIYIEESNDFAHWKRKGEEFKSTPTTTSTASAFTDDEQTKWRVSSAPKWH